LELCARQSSSFSDKPVTTVVIKVMLLSRFLLCGPILPRVLDMFRNNITLGSDAPIWSFGLTSDVKQQTFSSTLSFSVSACTRTR
jgi:hypothetical protein